MTALEIGFRYGQPPTPVTLRALDRVREVYGVRRIRFDETAKIVRVEYDASRLTEPVVAALLRRAGLELLDKAVTA